MCHLYCLVKSCYRHTILIISYYFIVLHILLNIVITLKSHNLEINKVIIIITLPPHLLSILKLWSNFIFGLNFLFFCFNLILHYHTQKPTYLGSMGNCLSRKAEMPTSVVDSGKSSMKYMLSKSTPPGSEHLHMYYQLLLKATPNSSCSLIIE